MSKNFFAHLGQRLNRSKFVRCLLSKFFVVVIIVISFTSSPEPLSQFQRNSKEFLIGGFTFFQMNGYALFPKGLK